MSTSPTVARKRKSRPSADTLITQIVEARLGIPEYGEVVTEGLGVELWGEVQRAISGEDPVRTKKVPLTRDEAEKVDALVARLKGGLNQDYRKLWERFEEELDDARADAEEAAYRLGVAVGRRIGGVR
jgi:hypothetical protein